MLLTCFWSLRLQQILTTTGETQMKNEERALKMTEKRETCRLCGGGLGGGGVLVPARLKYK